MDKIEKLTWGDVYDAVDNLTREDLKVWLSDLLYLPEELNQKQPEGEEYRQPIKVRKYPKLEVSEKPYSEGRIEDIYIDKQPEKQEEWRNRLSVEWDRHYNVFIDGEIATADQLIDFIEDRMAESYEIGYDLACYGEVKPSETSIDKDNQVIKKNLTTEPEKQEELVCMRCGSKENLNSNKDESFVRCDECIGFDKPEKQPEGESLCPYVETVGTPVLESTTTYSNTEPEKQEEWREEICEMIMGYAYDYHWNLEGWGDEARIPTEGDLEKVLRDIIGRIDQLLSERTFTKEELLEYEFLIEECCANPDDYEETLNKISKLLEKEEE
jgi:hypothetical protein